jgi:Glutaredoxin-like domain (DUF836)
MKEVVIYSKPDCCLCEEALQVLVRVQRVFPFALKKINILTDNDLYDQFKDQIPVVYIQSKKVFKYRVDEPKLLRLLQFS